MSGSVPCFLLVVPWLRVLRFRSLIHRGLISLQGREGSSFHLFSWLLGLFSTSWWKLWPFSPSFLESLLKISLLHMQRLFPWCPLSPLGLLFMPVPHYLESANLLRFEVRCCDGTRCYFCSARREVLCSGMKVVREECPWYSKESQWKFTSFGSKIFQFTDAGGSIILAYSSISFISVL